MRAETNANDINIHKVRVTGFKDVYAKTKSSGALTLPELRDRILSANAPTKDKLPWLKLATFGTKRTDAGCLRHDANVTAFDGIELDYDGKLIGGKTIGYDEAIETVKRMGTRCLIYTSPSHTPAAPRWRLLIPVSKTELRKEMRAKYVARVNGFFGNIFAAESFKLSQSYYYGRALDNPDADHRCDILEGKFINLQNELYRYEKDGTPEDQQTKDQQTKDEPDWENVGPHSGRGFENILAELGDSPPGPPELKGFHNVLRDAVASYVASHNDDFDRELLKTILRDAINAAPKNSSKQRAKTIERYTSDKYLDNDLIKTAIKKYGQQAQAQKAFKQQQQTAYGQSASTRQLLPLPANDAPWLPVMNKIDDILGASTDIKPPCRDIEGFVVAARKICIPKTHAYQDEPDETTAEIPPPEQWVLSRLSENELAELIEQHIKFVNFKKQAVHLQAAFVRHYHQRHESPLPIAVAIALSPIVLANGKVLADSGLNRKWGIIFEIPQEILDILPLREDCTPAAVTAAMKFLCDEWLCDVKTDLTGKSTIIAAALTIIERTLLPNRPTFFITAGRRGGGKSTVIEILIMAITGILPAASAWSDNEEERRKTLMAQFISGVSNILWDNIKRGSQISCPHIERACTAMFYNDRKLGVTEILHAAASAIQFFTGNNIGAKGDLASRSLKDEIIVDRTDPENRNFKHPDPIGWTEQHRGEILRALYTVMLGNPQLDKPRDAPAKTRFKLWWRLVGSAVEHAHQLLHGSQLDFGQLFLSQEDDDEDSATLADALDQLAQNYTSDGFTAADIAEVLNREHGDLTLRLTLQEFLYPKTQAGFKTTSKSVSGKLRNHLNNPVKIDDHTQLTLCSRPMTSGADKNKLCFYITKKDTGT